MAKSNSSAPIGHLNTADTGNWNQVTKALYSIMYEHRLRTIMNENLAGLLALAILAASYLMVRYAGMSGTEKGKFWNTAAGCCAMVLLVVTTPDSGASISGKAVLVFLAALLVWHQLDARRKYGTPMAHIWGALVLAAIFSAVIVLGPIPGGGLPPSLLLIALCFYALWTRYQAAYLRKEVAPA